MDEELVERSTVRYATFTSRFRAVVFDSAIVAFGVILLVVVGDAAERIPGSGRIIWLLLLALLLLYEPLLVWRRGATVGHAWNHLVVVAQETNQPPGFGRAFGRYILKAILGLPSFVTMVLTRRHQAVHDWMTRTTVQVVSDAGIEGSEFHLERLEDDSHILPSRLRRAVVMLAYLIGVFALYSVALAALDRDGCVNAQRCMGIRKMIIEGSAWVWLGVSLATIVAAWKGFLLGARRSRRSLVDPPVV